MNPNPLPPKFTGVSDNDDVLYGMRTCFPDVAEADRKSRTCAGRAKRSCLPGAARATAALQPLRASNHGFAGAITSSKTLSRVGHLDRTNVRQKDSTPLLEAHASPRRSKIKRHPLLQLTNQAYVFSHRRYTPQTLCHLVSDVRGRSMAAMDDNLPSLQRSRSIEASAVPSRAAPSIVPCIGAAFHPRQAAVVPIRDTVYARYQVNLPR